MPEDDTPMDENEDSGNVIQLDIRRKEEEKRLELEGFAGELVQRTLLEAVKSTVEYFTSDYLLNGYLLLLGYAKENFVIRSRLQLVQGIIKDHINKNVKVLFDHALKNKRFDDEAEKQRRLAEVRANQVNIKFEDYEEDKYPDYDQKSGLPLNTVINAQLALKHLGVQASFNQYKGEAIWTLKDNKVDNTTLFNLIYEKTRVQFPLERIDTALLTFAARRSFHPVKDYFASVEHLQPKGLIDTWLTKVFGAEDKPLNREIGKKMMCAMAARTYNPGTKFDTMVVLESGQGKGKSLALEILVGTDCFNSGGLFESDNSMKQTEALQGRMLYESADLAGHKKADADKVKAFLSKTNDRGRWVYDRTVKDFPRTAIIVGTTNLPQYLMDETGNRRFWPVQCAVVDTANMINGKPYVDTDWLIANRDQLWAEALHLFRSGYSLVLDSSLWDEVTKLQSTRLVEVPGIDKVPDVFGLNASEGLNITIDDIRSKMFEIRILSKDVQEYVFQSGLSANVNGRASKSAMLAYAGLEHGLRWQYKLMQVGEMKIIANGYFMTAIGEEQYTYLKRVVETCREARRKTGLGSNAVTL